MKGTELFKSTIQVYLQGRAISDSLFAETFKKKNKNMADCITYILNTVKASGCAGFADDEVYNMAVHYYDEDNIKIGSPIKDSNVVVNRQYESVKTTGKGATTATEVAISKIEKKNNAKLQRLKDQKKQEPSNVLTLF